MIEGIDFDAAESFLRTARDAYERGDEPRFLAARKLIGVALGLEEIPLSLRPQARAAKMKAAEPA